MAGVDVQRDPGEARKHIGYVPEEPALYDYLTAREFLEFIAAIREVDGVEEALAFTELAEDGERLIREYSQGMRRKTALWIGQRQPCDCNLDFMCVGKKKERHDVTLWYM